MVLNRQEKYAANLPALRTYVQYVKRVLRLGDRDFNICLVGDREMARLNAAFRSTSRTTDVLSFPWNGDERENGARLHDGEFEHFLGDVVISVETARRSAGGEGHSTFNEIRWLVLHGVLHLMGYDHETDHGEMTQLELVLRERLGIAGGRSRRPPPSGRNGSARRRAKRPYG